MTESKKQKLRLFSIILILASAFFWLEGQGVPGWKTGMAILPMAVLTALHFYLDKNVVARLIYAVCCLFFLFFAFMNFMAH